jgi:DNA-directed RNA polymerase delta subunit
MKYNYQTICNNLIKALPLRIKDVIVQRFGLKAEGRKTLEEIGQIYGITRERVRQIEEAGFVKLKPKLEEHQDVLNYFREQIRLAGNLRKEDVLLELLGGQKSQNQVFFLLNLGDDFKKFYQTKDFYSLWTIDENSVKSAKDAIDFLIEKFTESKKPLTFEEVKKDVNSHFEKHLTSEALQSLLEISKQIKVGVNGRYGLKDWSEINPRGVKDKAYLILKREKKPLHFTEVTKLINSSEFGKMLHEKALTQTVHNELIKDPRFVLVGRGLYALGEWGYQPGQVKDVILNILRDSNKSLTREEILEKVLKQRIVKANTVFLNLNNKKYFFKQSDGKYQVREA